jgi:ribosomal protein L12E/L44/L45/RPP1/RPP2
MVLFCAADLLWATRIKSTADALGVPCRPARTVEILAARLADSDIKGVIVDLEAGENALAIIRALRAAGPGDSPPEKRIPVVAFGPHVGVEAMAAAREAGAERVLARGAFDRGLPDILRALENGPS